MSDVDARDGGGHAVKIFLNHSSRHSSFVCAVGARLRRCRAEGEDPRGVHVFFYEDFQRSIPFNRTINRELHECKAMVVFVGPDFLSRKWQREEAEGVQERVVNGDASVCTVRIQGPDDDSVDLGDFEWLERHGGLFRSNPEDRQAVVTCAHHIASRVELVWGAEDDLPWNPHLFDYEKDIISFYSLMPMIDSCFSEAATVGREARDRRNALLGRLAEECPAWVGKELLVDLTRHVELSDRRKQKLLEKVKLAIDARLMDGCPRSWPMVRDWRQLLPFRVTQQNNVPVDHIGRHRPDDNRVIVAALSQYHDAEAGSDDDSECRRCMIAQNLCFPEAGPRERLFFPTAQQGNTLNVAVLVSGGIAPGINAVIDGIVQRHRLYADQQGVLGGLAIYGIKNGLAAADDPRGMLLPSANLYGLDGQHAPVDTSAFAHQGGSIVGTSRFPPLMSQADRSVKLRQVVEALPNIDILYVIGGDGSMKAAHALWSTARNLRMRNNPDGRPLSVVAIPKTMDNDILWMWQSFGFMSAVERAREVVECLHTEVKSNPRLCVLQLFGSDSGFVVSHAVLASGRDHCDAALIPESEFSIDALATHMVRRIAPPATPRREMPYGLVVMAETAIPTDARKYLKWLDESERAVVMEYLNDRDNDRRIEGQTDDVLRNAGLKMVTAGLRTLVPEMGVAMDGGNNHYWEQMRVVTNEPRHLLRAVSPSSQDIINGQRLGTLAVDNAMAGYTDFMISQWLTEYVLVPLDLVKLGRKRIPRTGIFWKSVVAKTGQPDPLI